MKLITVGWVAGADQYGGGGAAGSDFRFNLLSPLPVIALSILLAGLAAMAYIVHTASVYCAQIIDRSGLSWTLN